MIFMEEKRFNDVPLPEKSSLKIRDRCMVGDTIVQQDYNGNSANRCYTDVVPDRASASAWGSQAPAH